MINNTAMKKEFLTYKEALALKELGFNEESMMVYYGTSRQEKCNELYIPSGFGKIKNSHLITDEEKGIYWDGQVTAPLYQQAFDWFEKKHKLIHRRSPVYYSKKDIRNGRYDAIIIDLVNIDHVGTKALKFEDVGYAFEFIESIDEDEEDYSKMHFKTSRAADKACLKRMIQIVKERK